MDIIITSNCIKCGTCSEINGNIFEVTGEGAIFNPLKYKDTFENDCYDALFYCPVSAIRIH